MDIEERWVPLMIAQTDDSIVAGECAQAPGTVTPVIDRNRCEGKAVCTSVCPYNVFTVGVLPVELRKILSWKGKLKGLGHGWKQAFATNAAACHGCGLCVANCPEQAIRLEKV
jgi:4Fe-4S ferredoxin